MDMQERRAKVKKGLECCSKNVLDPCIGCPYERTEDAEWKCGLNADALALIEQLEALTDEEFKAEAKRRGYNLIKIRKKEKKIQLLPCVCGNKRISHYVTVAPGQSTDFEFYKCDKCGFTANLSKTNHQARINWNKEIDEGINHAAVLHRV